VLPAAAPGEGGDERVIPIGRSSLWRSPGWRAAAAIVLVGSVSWLATRSVGRQAEGDLASPTERSSVGAIGSTPQSPVRMQADSIAAAPVQSAPPSAARIAQPAPRAQVKGSTGSAATANAPIVPPAPAARVAAAPAAIPYAMPKFAESPNAGVGGGAGGKATMTAQNAAPVAQAAQAAPPAANAGAPVRDERRAASDAFGAGSAGKIEARMKSSAATAVARAPSMLETSTPRDAAVERLAGCYYMETAASQSSVPAIRAAAGLIPAQVELRPERDPGAGGEWRMLRPAPGAAPFRLAARASWLVLGADSVKLELGEGMESVSARLSVKGDSIHGNATVTDPALPAGAMGTGVRGSRMLCSTP